MSASEALRSPTAPPAAAGTAVSCERGDERALAGLLARVAVDLDRVATDGLRPAAMTVGVLFIVFSIYNWLTYPEPARTPVVIYDLALVVVGFSLYALCRRIRLTATGIHVAAAGLAFSVLGQIMVTTLFGVNPLFSFYVSVLLIASAGSVISLGWAALIAAVEAATWAVVASSVLVRDQLIENGLVVMTGIGVATIVHVGRRRARARIVELRTGDARRELALQRALAEADEARRELDRKVEERTAALRSELDERARLEEQLRHAQKLEAVGRLAGGIAHDFNNLLTVIRMSHTTMAEPVASSAERRDAMRDASDATDRAAALTHDLLAFARKQTLQRATVAIADVLGGVERMIRRVAEASIRVEVTAAGDAGVIVADRHQIEQVLLNLAINACDAMGNRGTLAIAADAVELAGADAERHRVRPGCYIRIAVSDTGTGMDEATRRSVFEPFFTTKEVGRGTGLGLAVAHGIVTQHGGQIDVESELGRGSTFTVFLPRSGAPPARTAVVVARPAAAPAHETVLVVEDEAAVRRAVARNLERLGYRVLAAHDGEDALRIAGGLDGVDLLLTDVVMPGIDGPELACRLRARWAELPVLFVTGYSADRLARSGAVGPRDKVLEKPYQSTDLARTIRQMLEARTALGTGAAFTAPRDS